MSYIVNPDGPGAPQHSLAPVSRLLELVPPVLCVLLLEGPHPSDDLLQRLVGLLGVIDDERGVFLLLRAVIHRLAATGLCHRV